MSQELKNGNCTPLEAQIEYQLRLVVPAKDAIQILDALTRVLCEKLEKYSLDLGKDGSLSFQLKHDVRMKRVVYQGCPSTNGALSQALSQM